MSEVGDGVDHFDRDLADSSTAPYDPDAGDVMLAAVENDLLYEAPQQRLALSICGCRIGLGICGSRPARTMILSLSGLPITPLREQLGRR